MDRQTANVWTTIFMIANFAMAMVVLGVLYAVVFGTEGASPETLLCVLLANVGGVVGMYRHRRSQGY